MKLDIQNRLFIVGGGNSGFGKAIAARLHKEGAHSIIVARTKEGVDSVTGEFDNCEGVVGDITRSETIAILRQRIENRLLDGIVVNAGGPPAMSFLETEIKDWDEAYKNILRWKIEITKAFLPHFTNRKYGRFVFIESASVKQPIENLVLSNSLRLAVVGFVKTLSQEIADTGITLNVLAPGYHATPAMERLFVKRGVLLGISPEEAKKEFEREIRIGKLGDPKDLASLAAWFLSPHSRYITGQTISVDGGLILGTMG